MSTILNVTFVIPGRPRTKKNSGRLDLRGGKPRKLPSKAFEEWNKIAQMYLVKVRFSVPGAAFIAEHFRSPVNCKALFYRDALRGDAVGYYQALADALQEGRIIENDSQIVSWDGSRILKDAFDPRIEVTLSVSV